MRGMCCFARVIAVAVLNFACAGSSRLEEELLVREPPPESPLASGTTPQVTSERTAVAAGRLAIIAGPGALVRRRHALGMAYKANGQIDEAVKLIQEVAAIRENTLAKEHPERLASEHALAVIYSQQGYNRERESTRSIQ